MNLFILGAGLSGLAAQRLAKKLGYEKIFLYDDSYSGGINYSEIDCSDLVVVSPGVPPENEPYQYAVKRGKIVKSEIEFAFDACKSPVIAITGTNGKTTTASLTHHLLVTAGRQTALGGNIGLPFSDFAHEIKPPEIAVLEVSSFMLETAKTFHPHIAALLNITPDHLDRHKTMAEYVRVKCKIFERQKQEDIAVLNADLDIKIHTAAKKYYFSPHKKTNGAYTSEGKIFFGGEYICDTSSVRLFGSHNIENALASTTIARLLDISCEDIKRGLSTFEAVSHRLEFVEEIEGVRFFNDSKATNIDGAVKAANSMTGDTVMILGGSDKGYEYDELFLSLPPTVKHCIFIGAVTKKLIGAAKRTGYINCSTAHSLQNAVVVAAKMLKSGNVLLSPAAASYDMFTNYIERGESFKKIVRGLKK